MNTIKYKLQITDTPPDEINLMDGVYIVVLHAMRTPPHIGMIVGGFYHSLSIKGQDIKISITALLKNIRLRSIPSLLIKIKPLDAFNEIYLMNRFIEKIKQFSRVDVGVATCLSPLKLLFEDEYQIAMEDVNYLYELLPKLEQHNILLSCSSLFIDYISYELPYYKMEQINNEIQQVRLNKA